MASGSDSEPGSRPEETVAEAEAGSLGEAKWSAMKELELRFPGLTAECVSFEVIEDGGEGGPSRVRAEVDEEAWREAASAALPEEPAERLRAVVTRVVQELGLRATVDVEETDEELRATVNGEELGLLIGKHGATIDALQHIAMRAALRGERRPQAGGGRRRRLPRAARGRAAPRRRPGGGRRPALRPAGGAGADAPAGAQGRPHAPARPHRRRDAQRRGRARPRLVVTPTRPPS